MPKITQAIKDNISIVGYAEMVGLHPVRRRGKRTSWTLKEHDSLVIKPAAKEGSHQWFVWNSTGQKGSVIDFAAAVNGWSVPQAISELRKLLPLHERPPIRADPPSRTPLPQTDTTKESTVLSLPEHGKGQSRVFAYLCKTRGLSSTVVSELVHEKKLYQDMRGNAVFVGMDYDGDPKYGALRGTHSDVQFRGDVSGSSKEVGFSMGLVGQSPTRLFVCEAPIDAMSIASMLEHYGRDPKAYAYLALGGTTTNALEYHLAHHPQLKTIYLCQDNDAAGHKSRAACRALLEQAGYTGQIVDKPPISKDFNDDLRTTLAAAVQQQQQPQEMLQMIRR